MKYILPIVITGYLSATTCMAGESVMLDCLIEPHMVIEISSAVEGTIREIEVDKSDEVKKGESLVKLDAEVEKATVALARARATMNGELKARKAAWEFANRKKERIEELYEKKAVPFHQVDEARTDAVVAELEFQKAREDKQGAELELRRATEVLKQRTVRSPIEGVVVDRYKAPGEFVKEEPILKIAQINPLKVEVIAPATMFGEIHSGMKATVIPEEPVSQSFEASVTIVDRVVDASSGTFGIRLELPNPDNQLPGGLKCQISFGETGSSVNDVSTGTPSPGVPRHLSAASGRSSTQ